MSSDWGYIAHTLTMTINGFQRQERSAYMLIS